MPFKRLCGIISICTLTSCAHVTPVAFECPRLILPKDPIVPIHQITSASKSNEVIKAWVATAIAYRDWNIIVRKQIAES